MDGLQIIDDATIQYPIYNKEAFEAMGLICNEPEDENDELVIVRAHKNNDPWRVKMHGECNKDISWAFRSVIYSRETGKVKAVGPVNKIGEEIDINDENVTIEE